PLSPILFALSIEPLLSTLSSLPFKINPLLDNTQAYADDTTIFVKGSTHMHMILDKIDLYGQASNAKANLDKSTLLPLNSLAKEKLSSSFFSHPFKLSPPNTKLTILGYHFNNDMEMHHSTWPSLITKLEKRLRLLKTRNISLKGRVLTAGSLLASKIWYTSYIFTPLMKQVDHIQKLINNWTRGDSKSLPSAAKLQLPKSCGGWNLTNIKAAIKARSASTT